MNSLLTQWRQNATRNAKANRHFLKNLRAKDRNRAEALVPSLHDEVFAKLDCLDCANCCKTLSPRVKKPDLERIAAGLRLRESVFIEKYLRLDEDGDYVMNTRPCPFLATDNRCSIYELRPRDCRRYPHSDGGDFFQRPQVTAENAVSCPAVFHIVERLRSL